IRTRFLCCARIRWRGRNPSRFLSRCWRVTPTPYRSKPSKHLVDVIPSYEFDNPSKIDASAEIASYKPTYHYRSAGHTGLLPDCRQTGNNLAVPFQRNRFLLSYLRKMLPDSITAI